ncbi:MAG: integrase core domain-containing protein [Puniceicoccales bacterium]|nr:integrase core domain-containing protein [Puniceicoccales bacterium]
MLTKFKHPWTNGLVERMNCSIKEQTVKIYFYETLNELGKHLILWLLAYNHQKKLRSLQYLRPMM